MDDSMMNQAAGLQEWVQKEKMQKTGTRVITVTSGKGGSGKTSFTVNVALELAKMEQRVLVLDADFGLANVDVMMGHPSKYNLSHVINESMPIEEVVLEGHYGVKFISGGSGVEALLNVSENQINALVEAMLALEKMADIILIDTGAGITTQVRRMARAASEVIIITTPEPTSIIDSYAMVKTLGASGEVPDIRLVINRAETEQEAAATINSFARIVDKYIHTSIDGLGYISNDPLVMKAVKAQIPLVMAYPHAVAAQDYARVARAIINVPEPVRKPKGLLQMMSRLARGSA